MNKLKEKKWKMYGFEFFLIFIAVISAFALNNWNENRKDAISENKILIEISNGLEKDIEDVKVNIGGHKTGIISCEYFRNLLSGNKSETDSVIVRFRNLTRDFVSIQNVAGYETLKSKGLELIKNDYLRSEIISLYEYDYNIIKKFEEEYYEMQFQKNYYKDINEILAPHFDVDKNGNITGINFPLKINNSDKNRILLHIWKIEHNRNYIMNRYTDLEKKINKVREIINNEINK